MIKCKCLVCNEEWGYFDDKDEDLVRAGVSPCGHQGLFEVIKITDKITKEKK